MSAQERATQAEGLAAHPYLTPAGAWAFSVGASIGWGSLIITANTYLVQAGPVGSTLGMLVGLVVMLIIARNYHYLAGGHPGPGGVYAYARDVYGYDHAVLIAWFLSLTYTVMLWANATSLPLFARYFMGGIFQWGFSYQILGYQVYFGEALLSIVAILLAGVFCQASRRLVQRFAIVLVAVIVVGIGICFGAAAVGHGAAGFSLEPGFVPDSSRLSQVLHIACMTPWAFIGFENISHLSDEFSFPKGRTFRVLTVSLVTSAALYVAVILLSTMAHPAGFDGWLPYLAAHDGLPGLEGLPAFFAAQRYLGGIGVGLLMAALLALVVSSLVANTVVLSRLLYAMAQDDVIPRSFATLNAEGVPARAIRFVMLISLVIPFLGRTTIGWIVDVTTLGATIIYGFVSACVLREARRNGDRFERATGIAGIVLMAALCAMLLLPNLTGMGSMATESYFLFTVWGVLGFIAFRTLLHTDTRRRFGKSVVTWLVLLSLVLFTSLSWFGQIANQATDAALDRVLGYYSATGLPEDLALSEGDFIEVVKSWLDGRVFQGIMLVGGLFMFSLYNMLSNFYIMRQREEESERKLAGAQSAATRDALTGVKNKLAFATAEDELNARIASGELAELCVVVCDVNGLKQVNDTLGHKAGDDYIRAASAFICQLFKHSPVFRIGGDEFAVLLQGSDYESRQALMAALDEQVLEHIKLGEVVVSAGMAAYVPGEDSSVHEVFERADALMYQRKRELKQLQGLPER